MMRRFRFLLITLFTIFGSSSCRVAIPEGEGMRLTMVLTNSPDGTDVVRTPTSSPTGTPTPNPTFTLRSTNTPKPSPTRTKVPTLTPTETSLPIVPVAEVWTYDEFWIQFMGHGASNFMFRDVEDDPSWWPDYGEKYTLLPTFSSDYYSELSDSEYMSWINTVYNDPKISVGYLCSWLWEGFEKGYGWELHEDRQELWEYLSKDKFGNPERMPYCKEFDPLLNQYPNK
jgi:hypothetical protein